MPSNLQQNKNNSITQPISRWKKRKAGGAKKPRLLFLIDTENWAYDNIFNKIKPALVNKYDITCLYITKYKDFGDLLYDMIYQQNPDIIHIFWRSVFPDIISKNVVSRCAKKKKCSPDEILQDLSSIILTTSVYDHLFLDEQGIKSSLNMFNIMDAYSTSSPILEEIYVNLPDYPKPTTMLADGIDLDFYKPDNLERFDDENKEFIVGWVGNSQWGLLEGYPDAKGLFTVIEPAIKLLQKEGLNIKGSFIDRSKSWRTREQVAKYYNQIDVYVCASLFEGTPNPVLEAMASGVPVISNNVGIINYAFGEKQKPFIIERSFEELAKALKKLMTSKEIRKKLSEENLTQIANHTWKKRHNLWLGFFEDAIKNDEKNQSKDKLQNLKNQLNLQDITLKQHIRIFLRKTPFLYSLSSKLFHILLSLRSFIITSFILPIKSIFKHKK